MRYFQLRTLRLSFMYVRFQEETEEREEAWAQARQKEQEQKKKKKTGFIFSRGIPERAVSDRPEDVERTDALPDACDFIGSISGSGDLFCLVRIPDDGKQIYHGEQLTGEGIYGLFNRDIAEKYGYTEREAKFRLNSK